MGAERFFFCRIDLKCCVQRVRVAKCFEYTHPKKIVIQVKTKYFEIQNTKWKCCPQFVTNLRVSFFCWTQRKIFWRAPL